MNQKNKRYHFVGVGGVGMGGLAMLYHQAGYTVTGSDCSSNAMTQRLKNAGVTVSHGHTMQDFTAQDTIVYSSAIAKDNPEILAANVASSRCIQRAACLAEVMSEHKSIAISGTHGKTTTSGMLTSILQAAGMSPSYAIGGLHHDSDQFAKWGAGDLFVAEADESDASFLLYNPSIAVVNNIERDHMLTYNNDFSQLKAAFRQFVSQVSERVVLFWDDENVRELATHVNIKVSSYGEHADADYRIEEITQDGCEMQFTIFAEGEQHKFILPQPGKHNVLNACAAICVARVCGAAWDNIYTALSNFGGMGRRFQLHGSIQRDQQKVLLVEDYAHHPSAIKTTIAAAKRAWPQHHIVACFQPHRYTRTFDLFDSFVSALSDADEVVLTDVYAAGEERIDSASSANLKSSLELKNTMVSLCDKVEFMFDMLNSRAIKAKDEVWLFMGAGSIGTIPRKAAEKV